MNKKAFTIIEIIVAIVMLGLLAAITLPNYSRAVAKGYERNALAQLYSIHAAAQLYKESEGSFPNSAGTQNVAWINNTYNLNIIEKEMAFAYTGTATAFTVDATLPSGTVIRALELPTGATNPCCEAGTCLLLTSSCP